jgi:hypothetical protein
MPPAFIRFCVGERKRGFSQVFKRKIREHGAGCA